jgi:hypothetical protein
MNDNDRDVMLKDHEGRIRGLEINTMELRTILKTTNKILITIATMIGGVVVKYLFDQFTK